MYQGRGALRFRAFVACIVMRGHGAHKRKHNGGLDKFGAPNYDVCGEHRWRRRRRPPEREGAAMQPASRPVLSESLQDYLEAVCFLVQRHPVARMKDIAAMMGVGKSSVTGAIQALAGRGLVNYGRYQFVTLTGAGEAAGRELVGRHRVLKRFLMEVLGVAEPEAETVGCKMEHAIKGDVLDRFVAFLGFVERRRVVDGRWAAALRRLHARKPPRAGPRRGRRRKA